MSWWSLSLIVTTLLIISTGLTSYGQTPISLQEAIKTAFIRNPITKANELQLEAAQDRARAAQRRILPQGSISISRSLSKVTTTIDGFPVTENVHYQGSSVSLSINLFRGGQDYYNAKAARVEAQTLEAINNSTDALLPDTKGALAHKVFDAYLELVANDFRSQLQIFRRQSLEKFRPWATHPDSADEINRKIEQTNNTLARLETEETKYRLEFIYHVKPDSPHFQLQGLDDVIQSLVIPDTSTEALEVALRKSPELAVANGQLQVARYRLLAQEGGARPQVDLSLSKSLDRMAGSPSYRSRGSTAAISASLPIDLGVDDFISAERKEVAAKAEGVTKVRDRLTFQIRDSLYPDFISHSKLDPSYQQARESNRHQLQKFLDDADNGRSFSMDAAIKVLESYEEAALITLQNKLNLVSRKFAIQKNLGTLFENLMMSAEEKSAMKFK